MLVATFLFFLSTVRTLYALSGRTPPVSFELLAWLGSGLLFAYLVRRDRHLHGFASSPADFGLLLIAAWPIAVPYHFFATRGRAGWRPFLVFVLVYLGSYVLTVLLFLLAQYVIQPH